MTKAEHFLQLKVAGEKLDDLHKRLIIYLAEQIRLMDDERRLSAELGVKSAVEMDRYWFVNAVYRVLNFGSVGQAFTILDGTADQIESLIGAIVKAKGFQMPNGTWMELA